LEELRVLTAHGSTDVGPIRKSNEDRFVSEEGLQLFVVADGMGGHAAGEVASTLAVETVVSFIRRSETNGDGGEFSWPYGIDPALSFSSNCLRTAVHLANRRVFRAAEKHDEYTGMGTTIVSALLAGSRLTVAHAGDSRAYLFANGALRRLTSDDTWESTVLAAQAESPAQPPSSPHPMRHVLTNVLGARETAAVHVSEHELDGGERILLCSDGLHGVVDDEVLRELLAGEDAPAVIVPRLIDAALSRGGRDNVTAVLIHYNGE
jgi:serine/threonine protein phosphatase PrpC